MQVTFDAGVLPVGVYSADLTIANNDLDENPVVVPVIMTISDADIDVNPVSFSRTQDRDEVTSADLTIANLGLGGLVFDIDLIDTTPAPVVVTRSAKPPAFLPVEGPSGTYGVEALGPRDAVGSTEASPTNGFRVLLLSGGHTDHTQETAVDFAANMTGLTFETFFVTVAPPTLEFLETFDVVLLYEDGIYELSDAVGDLVHQYVLGGGNVVIGTFFWQDTWGQMHAIEPLASLGGSEYNADQMDPASLVQHPLTEGLQTLTVSSFHGGAQETAGTMVVARWSDGVPLIGYQVLGGGQHLVAISTFPDYSSFGGFTGDFFRMWENALKWAAGGGGLPWLRVEPREGQVAPGAGAILDVIFDSTDLDPGTYTAEIVVNNNDPDEDPTIISADLTVLAPNIGVDPLDFNLGNLDRDVCTTADLTITNTGDGTLVFEITGDGTGDLTANPAMATVPPGGSVTVVLTICAPGLDPGVYQINAVIDSNDPDDPQVLVPLSYSVPAPDIQVSPSEIAVTGDQGQVITADLTISNSGDGTLAFDIELVDAGAAVASQVAPLASGGPDTFGYSYIDSDEPGGPAFDWMEISGTGATIGAGDDSSYTIPIGFDFEFYGNVYNTAYVGTNGILGFTNSSISSLGNQNLPSPSTPNNLVSAFWDDLVVQAVDRLLYEVIGQAPNRKLVVEWYQVREFGNSSASHTFEVILEERTGNILVQFLSMNGDLNSSTVGIENSTGDDGLAAVYNAPYIHDNLAVLFGLRQPYASVNPQSGTVAPGGSLDVTISFDATVLTPGTYTTDVVINNNDPDENPTIVTADLTVVPPPPPEIAVTPAFFDETLRQGETTSGDLTIENTGSGDLVFDISVQPGVPWLLVDP